MAMDIGARAEGSLGQFLLSLSFELANEDKPVESRRLAGILLKDSLATQWIAVDTVIKSQIKDLLLTTLASSVPEARHTAAQVIGKVASIDIPLKQWPQLFKSLVSNMSQQATFAPLKLATLETLGYVCEEISRADLTHDDVHYFLRALLLGMYTSKTSTEVHVAAIKTLRNSLELDIAKANFEGRLSTDFLMNDMYRSALSHEIKIRQAAFECLVSIASIYYERLVLYRNELFKVTSDVISGDEESVALQAIEFCSSICAIEIKLQGDVNPESIDWSRPPHHGVTQWTLSRLAPLLLETLLKQQGDGAGNISRACGTCLGLVARAVGVAIVPYVTSFVEAKISDPRWKSREGAMYGFGSILDGPASVKLAVSEFLLDASKCENKNAGGTTAWTLSRIFELLYSPASVSPVNLHRLVVVLLKAINDEVPNVAENICGAIYELARRYEDVGASFSLLAQYPTEIIQHLLAAAEHRDGEASKIRAAVAYDTLNVVVRCSNVAEASSITAHLLSEIIQEIDKSMHIPVVSVDDREKQVKLLASIRVVLRVLLQKLSGIDEQ